MTGKAAAGLVLAAGVGGLPSGPLGHTLSPEHAHHGEPAASSLLALLAVAGVVAVALALGRAAGRRALVLALVAVLTVLAFETALHSIHHLDEPDGGASCLVLSATAQVNDVSPPAVDAGISPPASARIAGTSPAALPPLRLIRAPEGRAPPVSRSA
jgi:hypothetical protein